MRKISLERSVRQPCQTGSSRPRRSRASASPIAIVSTLTLRPIRHTVCPGSAAMRLISGTPREVLKYVARYTHRVAISNDRLLDINDGKVRFRWKDYRDGNCHKTMTLSADEFIRRFLLHGLPDGFQRIRYFGFLANRYRAEKLALCREVMQMPPPTATRKVSKDYRDRYEALTGVSLKTCPLCRSGTMVVIETFECAANRAPIMDTS